MNIERKKFLLQQVKQHGFDAPIKLADELDMAAEKTPWRAFPDRAGLWISYCGEPQPISGELSANEAFKYVLGGPWIRVTGQVHVACRDDLESVQDAAAELERRAAQARLALDGKL